MRVMLKFLITNSEFGGASDQVFQVGPVVTGLSFLNKPLEYINDASGSATLFDPSGAAVPGAENIPVTYGNGSNGLYSGLIVGSVFNPPKIGVGYTLVLSLVSPTQGARQASFPAEVCVADETDC